MALLGFKKQFEKKILSGFKRHTIRDPRKVPIKVGETLYLYVGLRQRGAYKIGEFECVKIQKIIIRENVEFKCGVKWITPEVLIDDELLDWPEKESLARADGFENFLAMITFWNGRLPFEGQMIHWRYDANKAKKERSKCPRTRSATRRRKLSAVSRRRIDSRR